MAQARPVARSGSRDRALTVLAVTLAQFMAVMSTSSVSVALPTIGRALHASSTSLEWIVGAYARVGCDSGYVVVVTGGHEFELPLAAALFARSDWLIAPQPMQVGTVTRSGGRIDPL